MDNYWIWFKLIDIDYSKKVKLLNNNISIEKIYCLNSNILKEKFKFNKKEINSFMDNSIRKKAVEIDEYNRKNQICILNILNKNYPYLLKNIHNPPILIYYKGDINILKNKNVNIFIGKNINEYGKNILNLLCHRLYKDNISIISRNEKVDKNIYINNKSKGNDIIVLAEGINNSVGLKRGIILSEYEYDVVYSKTNLLNRNRILTGLSEETILIQSSIMDGSKYIVDLALEQGREISVIPGDIFKDNNKFTNDIIKQGARVITCVNELLVYEQIKNM